MSYQNLMLLQSKVQQSKNIDDPMNYFFDVLTHLTWFKQNNKISDHSEREREYIKIGSTLTGVIQTVCKSVVIQKIVLFEINDGQFFHGRCDVSTLKYPAIYFYFPSIDAGLTTFVVNGIKHSVRFSFISVPEKLH